MVAVCAWIRVAVLYVAFLCMETIIAQGGYRYAALVQNPGETANAYCAVRPVQRLSAFSAIRSDDSGCILLKAEKNKRKDGTKEYGK